MLSPRVMVLGLALASAAVLVVQHVPQGQL